MLPVVNGPADPRSSQRHRAIARRLIIPIIGGLVIGSALLVWRAWRVWHDPVGFLGGQVLLFVVDVEHRFDHREAAEAAVEKTAARMRDRLRKLNVLCRAIPRGAQIEVQVSNIGPKPDYTNDSLVRLLSRTGRLEFWVVDDDSEYMKKVEGLAIASRDAFPGIEIGHDSWSEKDSGVSHSDLYLYSADRHEIERFFARLGPADRVPSDHQIGYQWRDRPGADDTWRLGDKVWRTYYLHRRAELTGENITDVDAASDQSTGRPEVALTFDQQGASLFEKISGANVGRKLAIVLEEEINSAPVIESRIVGGNVRITLGGAEDSAQLKQQVNDLVSVLRVGALAAPVELAAQRTVAPTRRY